MILGTHDSQDHLFQMFILTWGILPGVDFKFTELGPFHLKQYNMITNILLANLVLAKQFSALHKYSHNNLAK